METFFVLTLASNNICEYVQLRFCESVAISTVKEFCNLGSSPTNYPITKLEKIKHITKGNN